MADLLNLIRFARKFSQPCMCGGLILLYEPGWQCGTAPQHALTWCRREPKTFRPKKTTPVGSKASS